MTVDKTGVDEMVVDETGVDEMVVDETRVARRTRMLPQHVCL